MCSCLYLPNGVGFVRPPTLLNHRCRVQDHRVRRDIIREKTPEDPNELCHKIEQGSELFMPLLNQNLTRNTSDMTPVIDYLAPANVCHQKAYRRSSVALTKFSKCMEDEEKIQSKP